MPHRREEKQETKRSNLEPIRAMNKENCGDIPRRTEIIVVATYEIPREQFQIIILICTLTLLRNEAE